MLVILLRCNKKGEGEMIRTMKWLFLLSGVLFVVMGMMMLSTPLKSLVVMAIYIGMSMFISGISEISMYFNNQPGKRSGWILAGGILSTLFGTWAIFGSGAAVLVAVLPFLFAVWVMSSGVIRIAGALSMEPPSSEKGWMLFLGFLNAILGFAMLFSPYFSAAVAAYAIAFMFIAYGINNMYIFFVLKKIN